MARYINKGRTILEYIDAVINLNLLLNQENNLVALNNAEWTQLEYLLDLNHNNCLDVVEVQDDKKIIKYKDMWVYYDNSGYNDLDYLNHLSYLEDEIRTLERQAAGGNTNNVTGNDVRTGGYFDLNHIPRPRPMQNNLIDTGVAQF